MGSLRTAAVPEQERPASRWLARQVAAGRLDPSLDTDHLAAVARVLEPNLEGRD